MSGKMGERDVENGIMLEFFTLSPLHPITHLRIKREGTCSHHLFL